MVVFVKVLYFIVFIFMIMVSFLSDVIYGDEEGDGIFDWCIYWWRGCGSFFGKMFGGGFGGGELKFSSSYGVGGGGG